MKKFLASLFLAAAVAALGCWEYSDGGSGGGTGSIIVTPEVAIRLDGRPASGGLTVSLPAQLDISVITTVEKATLQVRQGTSGAWITVREVSGAECAVTGLYRPIFGRDTFTTAVVGNGEKWQFRVHVVTGIYQNFSLDSDTGGAYTVNTATNRRPVWED